MPLDQLREKRNQLAEKLKSILDRVDREGRDLTQAEDDELMAIQAEFDKAQREILSRERLDGLRSKVGEITSPYGSRPPISTVSIDGNNFGARREPTGLSLQLKDGRTIRCAKYGENIAPTWNGPDNPLGRAVRMALTNRDDPELRDSVSGLENIAGGYLVPQLWAATIVDKARSQMHCLKAGAQTLAMDSGDMILGKILTDPTPRWRGEFSTIQASSPVFGAIELNARTLAILVPCSIEWLEDAVGGAALIEQTIAKTVAQELDRVMLIGGSEGLTGDPTGVINWTGISKDATPAAPTWHTLLSMRRTLLDANVDSGNISFFMSPRDEETILGTRENGTSGQFLVAPAAVAATPTYVTTQLPSNLGSGNDESWLIAGDFSNLLLGVRTAPRIEVFRGGDDNVSKLSASVRIYTRVDTAILRADHFAAKRTEPAS